MPHRHHRPLTDAEIAEIRRHGPGFWIFKRAKDNRQQFPIGRYITHVVALVIVAGGGYLLYKYVLSKSDIIAAAAHFFGK
jgi:hypothetical protein